MASQTREGILQTRLSNGLTVLLKEDHSAPIVSVWTWYRVGSRNELPGRTGVSHWVEHMQFKGTPDIAKGQIFRDVSSAGGTLNALTSHDWTAYFETLPVDKISLALDIESDRMTNSLFDPAEVDSERTVILSERQGSENNPAFALYEEVTGTAFHAHPYRHMVIGYESDLRQITRDDLYSHYRRHYHPGNAFIVAVGDFDADELLQQIEARFGEIPEGDSVLADIGVTEPPQPGERRVLIRKPSGAPYLRMGYHAPKAAGSDTVPLLVAEAVLSGGQPMGFGGGGSMGRSSRLYRSLVATGLARAAASDMSLTIDPYLFQIGVTGLPETDLARVEETIDVELARLRDEPVSEQELARAIRQLESQFIYSAEGVTNQAYWLGYCEIVDSWERAVSLPDEIRAVSADDVQRVAQRYLASDKRTVGWLEPSNGRGVAGSEQSPVPDAPAVPLAWGLDGPHGRGQGLPGAFQRAVLSNGIPVLVQERPESRSIALRMRLAAGSVWEVDPESGIAFLAARAAQRGSGGQSFDAISTRTDELGSSLSVDAGRQFVEARVRSLRDDLPEMASLLAQTLRQPDYPEDEVERVKAEQLGAISETDNDTRSTADRLLRRSIYPEPNPLGRRVLGTASSVSALNRDAVRQFHDATYGPDGASIALVGGIGSMEQAVRLLEDLFGDWSPRHATRKRPSLAGTNSGLVRISEQIPGKSQADLAVGLATIARDDNDFYALDVANLILGRLGLMGRLGAEVRDRNGLAYYTFSQLEPRRDGSLWSARAGVDPENIERALQAIQSELVRLRAEPVTTEEFDDARSYLVGVLPLALESHDGVASTLLSIEEFDLGLDYLDRYPRIIASLTRDNVLQAAERHLDPAHLAMSVARPS